MTNNKTTYVLEIDAEIDSLKREIDQAKKALTGLGDSPFGKGLEKKFGTILSQIDKLQKKASQPITSKSTFDSLEKGFGDVVVDAKNLLKEMQSIRQLSNKEKISLLPPDEAKRLREAINAVQDYERAIDRLERKRVREFESAKISKSETASKLNTAKETQKTARQSLSAATGKGSAYGDAQALIQQAEAAKKAKKEIKELDKQIADYRSELEELKKLESLTEDQKGRAATLRKNISSLAGQKGAKTKLVNAGPDETQLTAARNTVAEQAPAIEALEKAAKEADAEVTRLENSLAKLNEKINNNSESITQSQSDYKVMYEQAKKLGVSLEGVTEDVNPQNIQILTTRLKEMVNEGLLPIDSAADEIQRELEELGNVAQTTGDKIARSSENFDALTENNNRINNLKQTVAQFIGWTGATKALSAAMRNAFRDIKELDAAMTEIAVVTDFDIGDMWDQLPTYTARANELGLSITEVYESSALFYQQGLDTNEMVALSNETLKMAKIAGLSAADATDRMTAALRGFNMELNETSARKISDVYSELAAITASDVNEISKAMTKTASIASSAGMEFETTAAFLSQIIETTRESAETAGTAMKTVIARFQELKKDPSEMGEVDGEMIDANAIETALRSVGVSLRDASGQFRELDDVFLELSSKWDSLDKNTQRYIATIAAGSRQQSRFIAMMSDYERTQELVTAANNSAGASQQQYEKTLESLKTKLKRLENAWTEFSTGLMNSDFVKGAVDLLTNILNAINRVTKGFEGFTSSLSKIGTLVAIFNTAQAIVGKFFDEIVAKVYKSAYRAGENIAKGTNDGIQSAGLASRLTGYAKMREGADKMKNGKVQAQADLTAAKTEQETVLSETTTSLKASGDKVTSFKAKEATARQKVEDRKNAQKTLLSRNGGNDSSRKALKNKKALAAAEEELLKITEEREAAEKEYDAVSTESKKKQEAALNKVKEKELALKNVAKEGFATICEGAQQAAQGLTLVGAGLGVVGQMFSSMGLEGLGEAFSTAGQWITMFGSALTILIPIIKFVGTTFTIEGGKIAIAGTTAQLAWWWVLLIVAAVVALVALTAAALKSIQKNSPEAKLEAAKEAANEAAEAADAAAGAYENLKQSFEDLDAGYEALEKLTKGTEEWNEAVRDVNKSVLDLIAEYPELAGLVTNEGGVLTIDTDSAEAQAVMDKYERNAQLAQASSLAAQVRVLEAQGDVAYGSLNGKERIGKGDTKGKIDADKNLTKKERTTGIATALAEGIIKEVNGTFELIGDSNGDTTYAENRLKELGYSADDLSKFDDEVYASAQGLREYGETLMALEEQSKTLYDAWAMQALSMVDTSNMTEEEKAQMYNLVQGDAVEEEYAKLYDEAYDTKKNFWGQEVERENRDVTDDELEKFMLTQDGVSKVKRVGNNKVVYYDDEGNKQKVDKDVWIKKMLEHEATEKVAERGANIAGAVDQFSSRIASATSNGSAEKAAEMDTAVNRLMADGDGSNLTVDQIKSLQGLSEEELRKVFSGLDDKYKEALGGEDAFVKKFSDTVNIASDTLSDLSAQVAEAGGDITQFGQLTLEAAEGIAGKITQLGNLGGPEAVKEFTANYNNMLAGADEETKGEITTLMNGLDWTNLEDLLSLQIQLKEIYGLDATAVDTLINGMVEATNATSSLGATVQVFGDFYHATEKVNAALRRTSDLQWEYERLLKGGGSTQDLSKNLEEQWNSILRTGNEAMAAYQAAQEDQVRRQASGANIRSTIGTSASDYLDIDEETGIYDLTRLQEQIDAGHFGEEGSESYEAITKYIEDLKEGNTTMQEQLDVAKDAYEQLEEIKEQAEESYWDLYDQVSEAIIGTMEKELEIQQDLLAATEEANAKLLDKMQQQIDEDRQAREQEKTEKEINELRSQAKFLSMETSGVNLLQLLDLEKQIEEAEEGYRDSLVDQALQNLSDANDKMIEQGERQINIAEQQLAAFEKSDQFSAMITSEIENFKQQIKDGVDVEDTTLGEKLKIYQEDYWKNPGEQKDFWTNLNGIGAQITTVEELINGTEESKDGSITDLLNKIEKNTDTSELLNYFAKGDYESANQQNNTTKDVYGVSFENEENTYDTDASGKVQLDDKGAPIINYTGTRAEDYKNDMTKINALSTGDTGTKVKAAREQATNITNRGTSTILGGTAQEALNAVHALGNESAYYSSSDFTYEDELALRDAYASGEVNPTGAWHTQVNNKYQAFDEAWRNAAHEKIKEIALDYRRDGFESAWNDETIQKIVSEGNQFFPDGIVEGGSRYSGQDYVLSILTTDLKNQYETEGGWATVDADGDEYHTNGIGDKIDKPWDWEYFGVNGEPRVTGGYTVDGKEYSVTWDSTIPINPPEELKDLNPQDGWVASIWTGYGYIPIVYRGQHKYGAPPGWYGAMAGSTDLGKALAFKNFFGGEQFRKSLGHGPMFKTGGLADFTGPAWLDGTKSKPEIVLNQRDSANFIMLRDILQEAFSTGANTPVNNTSTQTSGDNHFEIEINVEKLENDYDVDKLANKIRSMIYEDATYRNVNAVGMIR